MTRSRVFALLACLIVALTAQPSAASAAAGHPQMSKAHAQAALGHVKKLLQGKGVETGYELSPALAQLAAALPSLSGDDRLAAEAILARPDDNQPDPSGTHKWTPPIEDTAHGSPVCSAHFCVHWTLSPPDASNAAYATQLSNILEQVYTCENGTGATDCATGPGLGWRAPAPDEGLGGNDKVDVYIEDLFTNEKVFGYVAIDPGQTRDPSVPHHAYMVLDKDYSRFAPAGADPAQYAVAAADVTAAHEYNHVLQNAYDYLEDGWMFESTAVYMEDKVYPSNNDYLNYVKDWVANTRQPMTLFSGDNLKAYGSAVWNHWIDHRFGAAAVRGAWEQSVAAADFAPGAYGAAIAAAGGGDFPSEFDRFATAVSEWDVPGAGFPDPYPDVPRDGTMPVGTQTTPFSLAHTTFAFFDVPVPANAPPRIRLTGTLPSGTAGAIALVGRVGPDPSSGTVTSALTPMPTGGTAIAELDNPAQFGRITAVVVNSDPSKSGFDANADDYVFTKDATGVVVSMAEPGQPIPTTGGASQIADHTAVVAGAVDPHMLDTTWQVEYGPTSSYGKLSAPQTVPAATVGAAAVSGLLTGLAASTTFHYRVVATNSAGRTAGQDMTFTTARDVTKPKLVVKVKRQKFRKVARSGAVYQLSCSEDCKGSVQLVIGRRVAKRLALKPTLAKGAARVKAQPKPRTLRVRLTRSLRGKFGKQKRVLRAQLRVSVADASGNRTVKTVRVKFVR